MQHSSGLTENLLNRYQSRWHSMELVIGNRLQNINYNYQLHCVPIVQLQLQLQLLQECNQLQLITITNYNYNITAIQLFTFLQSQ